MIDAKVIKGIQFLGQIITNLESAFLLSDDSMDAIFVSNSG